jgi:hypothetical protein
MRWGWDGTSVPGGGPWMSGQGMVWAMEGGKASLRSYLRNDSIISIDFMEVTP